ERLGAWRRPGSSSPLRILGEGTGRNADNQVRVSSAVHDREEDLLSADGASGQGRTGGAEETRDYVTPRRGAGAVPWREKARWSSSSASLNSSNPGLLRSRK